MNAGSVSMYLHKMRSVILILLKKIPGIEKFFKDFQFREGALKREQEAWPPRQAMLTTNGTDHQGQRTY